MLEICLQILDMVMNPNILHFWHEPMGNRSHLHPCMAMKLLRASFSGKCYTNTDGVFKKSDLIARQKRRFDNNVANEF